MKTDDKRLITALWFDRDGCGPDVLAFELHPFRAEKDGKIPASLGLRVRAEDIVINAEPMIDGGFKLGIEQVEELCRRLGEWLTENRPAHSEHPILELGGTDIPDPMFDDAKPCKCGACCDYSDDGTECMGQVECLNPDAVCPAHCCQSPTHTAHPNAQARAAEQQKLYEAGGAP